MRAITDAHLKLVIIAAFNALHPEGQEFGIGGNEDAVVSPSPTRSVQLQHSFAINLGHFRVAAASMMRPPRNRGLGQQAERFTRVGEVAIDDFGGLPSWRPAMCCE